MTPRSTASAVLAFVVGGAIVYAIMKSPSTPATTSSSVQPTADPIDTVQADPHEGTALPPNHPPIGGGAGDMGGGMGGMLPANTESPGISWKMPAGWKEAPSTSSMRLATYHPPPAPGTADETEVSVVRAGGSTDANIDRWIHQFDDARPAVRTEKTIAGFKVTTVEVSGTFLGGGMMPGATSSSHKDWTLLAAIVETPGSPYFFKMTGPTATVKAAHTGFTSMLDSITKP